jgi:hypothetical protein
VQDEDMHFEVGMKRDEWGMVEAWGGWSYLLVEELTMLARSDSCFFCY